MEEKEDVFYENINMKKLSVDDLIYNKKLYFYDVIQNTVLHIQNNKMLDILGMSEMEMCIEILSDLSEKLREMDLLQDNEEILNGLQEVNDELSSLFKKYGTLYFEQLLCICFGNNHEIATESSKYDLLKKYFHPTGYKVVIKREHSKNKKGEEIVDEDIHNLDCFDVYDVYKQFHMKVYGIKIYIYDAKSKKELMLFGTMNDVIMEYLNNEYLKEHLFHIRKNVPKEFNEFDNEVFDTFLQFLNLKDLLICKNCTDVYNKFAGFLHQYNNFHQKSVSQNIKVFLSEDMYSKRNMLMCILMNAKNLENLHLAYLLYDILSNDVNGNVDTEEQTILFDSFTWKMKRLFKKAMKKTIDYANNLSSIDLNKISFEQQICLMKASDIVKEKAIAKLREMKSKSEDSGTKPRQFLEGLLKIPFKIYKREPILDWMEQSKNIFKQLTKMENSKSCTSIEIINYLDSQTQDKLIEDELNILKYFLLNADKSMLMQNVKKLNILLKKYGFKKIKIHSNKEILREECNKYTDICSTNNLLLKDTIHIFKMQQDKDVNVEKLNKNMNNIKEYMTTVKTTLDDAIYGHDIAKKQIEKIIGQWINGEQDGYCFGFEGPPGVGKTSLAKKGLSNCLKDENGEGRPFSFIAIGGDSNGSTLHGHNYTYVSSMWGSIVQILMDKKCMNPIIFIDEVDKISRTEHGKEIIGILTHLLDPAQNDTFQDKYFAGIDLDLSKALFILSYNDSDAIDSILLDRVHRIKFNSLSVEEKMVICKKHLLPEICLKMGLTDVIEFPEETIKFIIDEYTCEAGVRKLKEQLFDIVGEINLCILKRECTRKMPIKICIEDVKNVYFKDKKPILLRTVSDCSQIGYINGMYATVLGNGGVLPIHAKYFPCDTFLQLKLTGLQEEVMRESMNVALTVAWDLTDASVQRDLREKYDKDGNRNGINIHTGDNAVSKDGPSGGCAITIVIYSLLNKIAIKPEIGVTGEIQMSGEVTAIGGLSHKIQGSLKQGVKVFLYPKENKRDFDAFYEKYGTDKKLNGITFHAIEHVREALDIVLVK